MAFVITEPCIGTQSASCMAVCPVDCIYAPDGDAQCYINPDECIDCGACASECPVSAIFAEQRVPARYQHFIEAQRDARLHTCRKPPMMPLQ